MPRLPGPKFPRAAAGASSNRGLSYGSQHGVTHRAGRLTQLVCHVKTGSSQMVRSFHHFVRVHNLNAVDMGADERAGLPAGERGRITRVDTRPDGTTRTVEQLAPDDTATLSQFLVYGRPQDMAAFVATCTHGKRQPVAWAEIPETRRVIMGSGESQLTDAVRKKVRDIMRGKDANEWRDEIARRDRLPASDPENPYAGEAERVARGNADHFLQLVFDTSVMTDDELESAHDALTAFYLKNGRAPLSREELAAD